MKKLIAGLILAGGLGAEVAQADVLSPMSCAPVTISSTTPTEVTGNTTVHTTTAGVDYLKVTNMDTSNDLFCSHDVAVSTLAANVALGDPIGRASTGSWNWLSWTVGRRQLWYCKASISAIIAGVCLHKS